MTHPELINIKTRNEIANYLSLYEPPGLILQGTNGLGKSEAARYIAASLLNCKEQELSKSPDFFETTGEGAVKAENMDELLLKSTYGDSPRQMAFPFKLYTDTQALKIVEYGLKHLTMLQNAYTKNDYFNLVRFIIQVQ